MASGIFGIYRLLDMRGFAKFIILAKLISRLGYANIFRVVHHRIFLRFYMHPVCGLKADMIDGPFFTEGFSKRDLLASQAWRDTLKYFDWYEIQLPPEGLPNWFSRPFMGGVQWPSEGPWWKLEGPAKGGDIKEVWDLSRFNWSIAMAQRAANGDSSELNRLNKWLHDWSKKNPPYDGPNWGCGQEASIRVLHLAITAVILEQDRFPTPSVLSFIKAHLARIASTLSYAISQDNNHGILEAAGLFVGGEWLCAVDKDFNSRQYAELGRKWIEDRVQKLVSPDGSFSMYSVAYHREFLDALSVCEFWRERYLLNTFSPLFRERLEKTTFWLRSFVNPNTGDAPNIGANDGTRLIPLTDTDYRDFRPSVQLASVLFTGKSAYGKLGSWNLQLKWLGLKAPEENFHLEESQLFDDSGFAVLRGEDVKANCQAFIRYPRFRFRPSHADALHLDLWVDGVNLLRDGGSYSYDPLLGKIDYFSGTQSHNTVQFDGREQMPRCGTFLFGNWLNHADCTEIKNIDNRLLFKASYIGNNNECHERSVSLATGRLIVSDSLNNFSKNAILRWRLLPQDWIINGEALICDRYRIYFESTIPIRRFEIIRGYESRYYRQINEIPVLEIEISSPGTITSTVLF